MSDLMPLGADQLVFNILQWYRIFPHPAIVRFALLVVKVCGTPVYGAFNRADIMSALFLDNMRQCVDETLTYTTPAQLREFTPMISYIAVNFLRYLPYFAMKMRTPGVIAAHGEPVTKGGETKAVQICSLILYILGSPHLDPKLCTEDSLAALRTDTMYLACMVFRRYKLDRAPGSPMRLHPAIIVADSIQQRHPLADDRHNVIATAMYICRFYYICVTPGCKNCFINPNELLRTCSGCSTVRYCGQECQTKDWKEEPYKHKKLCKILSTIMAAFGSWKLAPLGNLNDKPFEDHRVNDLKRRHDLVMNLRAIMLKLTSQNKLSEEDVLFTWEWAKTITDTDVETDQRPIVEWHPGYEDYDEILQRVEKSQLFKAPTAKPMNPIAT
ncbi:hypothetical protein BJ165DRAFT_1441010 [Panaeolus papilionaceus]|nr:hypothetical protein BJ165DRAFT_1441010 [Panaeolus papilionaceus]